MDEKRVCGQRIRVREGHPPESAESGATLSRVSTLPKDSDYTRLAHESNISCPITSFFCYYIVNGIARLKTPGSIIVLV